MSSGLREVAWLHGPKWSVGEAVVIVLHWRLCGVIDILVESLMEDSLLVWQWLLIQWSIALSGDTGAFVVSACILLFRHWVRWVLSEVEYYRSILFSNRYVVGTLRTRDILVLPSVLLSLIGRIWDWSFVALFVLVNPCRIGGVRFYFLIHQHYTTVVVVITIWLGVVTIRHTLDSWNFP